MKRVEISRSSRKDKRFKAAFGGRAVHFGSKSGSTFIDHKDEKKKAAWEARHRVNEDWSDYDTAGALAKHLLWNKRSMKAAVRDLNGRQKQYRFVVK